MKKKLKLKGWMIGGLIGGIIGALVGFPLLILLKSEKILMLLSIIASYFCRLFNTCTYKLFYPFTLLVIIIIFFCVGACVGALIGYLISKFKK